MTRLLKRSTIERSAEHRLAAELHGAKSRRDRSVGLRAWISIVLGSLAAAAGLFLIHEHLGFNWQRFLLLVLVTLVAARILQRLSKRTG